MRTFAHYQTFTTKGTEKLANCQNFGVQYLKFYPELTLRVATHTKNLNYQFSAHSCWTEVTSITLLGTEKMTHLFLFSVTMFLGDSGIVCLAMVRNATYYLLIRAQDAFVLEILE